MRLVIMTERLTPWRLVAVAATTPSRRPRKLMFALAMAELVFTITWMTAALAYTGGLRLFAVQLLGLGLSAGAVGAGAALLAGLVIWRREGRHHA